MGERAHFLLPLLSVPVISMRFMKHGGCPKVDERGRSR